MTFIALTEFARVQMIRDGYEPLRIVVKGNAAPDVGLGHACRDRRIVFACRLTNEKKADFLLPVAHRIVTEFEIIGDGPERERLLCYGTAECHHPRLARSRKRAIPDAPADDDMHMRRFCVPMIDRSPVRTRTEIVLGIYHYQYPIIIHDIGSGPCYGGAWNGKIFAA